MRRSLIRLSLLILAIFAAYFALLYSEWFPLSTPAGKRAVLLMGAPPVPVAETSNAFTSIWLFPYDIPEAEIKKVMARDINRYSSTSADISGSPDSYGSYADGKYPKFEDADKMLCLSAQENCLEKIRANMPAYSLFFAKHEKLVRKAVAVTNSTLVDSSFAPTMETPIPNYGSPITWQLTTAAFWHAKGRQTEALVLACDAAKFSRAMAENSNGLIEQMVGLAFYAKAARFIAELLSETPREIKLPANCEKAFAAIEAQAFPICRSIQREFQSLSNAIQGFKKQELFQNLIDVERQRKWNDSLFNNRATREGIALALAQYCSNDSEITEVVGKQKSREGGDRTLTEVLFNPAGSELVMVLQDPGTYSNYQKRMENLGLVQQAMHAVFAERVSGDWSQPFADGLLTIQYRLNDESKTIDISLYKSVEKNELLSLPLAGSRLAEKTH